MKAQYVVGLCTIVSCGEIGSQAAHPDASATSSADAMQTCDPTARFDAPRPIPGLEINGGTPRLSCDELTIYFFTGNPSHANDADLWLAHRSSPADAFGAPAPMTAQDTPADELDPAVSADGMRLWFISNRAANEGFHIYIAERTSTLAEFGAPGLASAVNAADATRSDIQPFETMDGRELWFSSSRVGGQGGLEIWHAVKSGGEFSTPTLVSELNSPADDVMPTLSADGLTAYFSSNQATIGGRGGLDIWTAHRSSAGGSFSLPTLVDELNTSGNDYLTWISPDNCRAYGVTNANEGGHYFMAVRQR